MKDLFFLFSSTLIFAFCLTLTNCKTSQSAASNPLVQDFLTRFNKEKFLEELDNERSRYEGLVSTIKQNGVKNPVLKEKYAETQMAFNKVISDMKEDINAAKSIIGYKIIDNEGRYRNTLEDAKIVGGAFTKAALEEPALDGKVPLANPIAQFSKMFLWPLIQKVHNRYLDHVKGKMNEKLNSLQFRDWDAI